jgi:large subunit ribosomal protein L25
MLLKAQLREVVGKKVQKLREQKLTPASVYGPSLKTTKNIVLNTRELKDLYKKVGYSALFDLEVEGEKPIKALFKEVQIDYFRREVLHASIYAVDMSKPIVTSIPVHFTGVSLAVKNNLGLLVTPMTAITVHCLPDNIPTEILVDISKLDNVGDSVFLKDIKLPAGVNAVGTHVMEQMVAAIASPQKTVEEEAAEAAPAEGEVAAEGEAGAEGAAAAEGAEGAVPAKGKGTEGAAAPAAKGADKK